MLLIGIDVANAPSGISAYLLRVSQDMITVFPPFFLLFLGGFHIMHPDLIHLRIPLYPPSILATPPK